jgi:hypothetical protein
MESPLSFNSSENFRKKLLTRNLPPYKVDGSFNYTDKIQTKEFELVDYAITDSPTLESISIPQEKSLIIKNQYGPENQNVFGNSVNINIDLNYRPNEGEYTYTDSINSDLETIGNQQEGLLYIKNLYGPANGTNDYGETININNTFITNSNLGNYGYPLTIGSKLELKGDDQERFLITKNVYQPIGLGDFGSTVWYINNDQNILTVGNGEYNIEDTLNSYLYQIGNNQEVFHKVKNLYKPESPEDYGNTVWFINNDQTILSMGGGTYTIDDTIESYLYQIGNDQEVFHKTKNVYKPFPPKDYGNTVWYINNDQTIFTTGSGIYDINDALQSNLGIIGNAQEITLITKNVYKPTNPPGVGFGYTVWNINDDETILTTGSGQYDINDTFGNYLEQIGDEQERKLIIKNKYSPENADDYGSTRYNINKDFILGSNEGNYNYFDTIKSQLEEGGVLNRPTLISNNQYGPQDIPINSVTINDNLQTNKNEGEYGFPDTIDSILEIVGEEKESEAYGKNTYVPQGTTYGNPELVFVPDLPIKTTGSPYLKSDSTYVFLPSEYTPYSILISDNPSGSDGSLSQDSNLANLGAKQLQKEFKFRVNAEILQQTLGSVNAIESSIDPDTGEISAKPNLDPFDAAGILTGNIPLLSLNYAITSSRTLVGDAINFAARLAGLYSPYSYIVGELFDYPGRVNSENTLANNALSVLGGSGGPFFNNNRPANDTASETLIEFTSTPTKNILFRQLSFNYYRPDYANDSLLLAPKGKFYIGDNKNFIKNIVSPSEELPESQRDGISSNMAVFSYGKVGEEYEGKILSNSFFGLNSRSYFDGLNGLQAGLTWISQAANGENWMVPGKFAGPLGSAFDDNSAFNFTKISSSYDPTKSTRNEFTQGSLLDVTQKIIDAGTLSKNKLEHVGNAINQVSKVFNDGYIELTKGSRVIRYTTPNSVDEKTPTVKGYEYCRLFTKDRPYMTYDELQKVDGNIRKYSYSVLDNTYNLNIAPWLGNESTNIVDGKVKKYMFSLENLAWRSSNKKDFTYEDLPACERGPNGGRIMWFPPYDLSFDESVSTNWTDNNFLGRPEPIYTFNNSSRKGSLSWKIIVDHPSILNVILNEELEAAKATDTEITKVIESFFAGCVKYDLYDLVVKFPMFTPKDVFDVTTQIIEQPDIVDIIQGEPFETIETIQVPYDIPEQVIIPEPSGNTEPDIIEEVGQFKEVIFFFHNDYPNPDSESETSTGTFETWYNKYLALKPGYLVSGSTNDDVRSFRGSFNKVLKYNDPNYGTDYSAQFPLPDFSSPEQVNDLTQITYLKDYIEWRKEAVERAFSYIESEFAESKRLLTTICKAIKQGAIISFDLLGSASSVTTVDYNINLSKRRLDSVEKYIRSFKYDGVDLNKEWGKKLKVRKQPQGETTTLQDPVYKAIDCSKGYRYDSREGTTSVNAMACRRVRIVNIKAEGIITPEPVKEEEIFVEPIIIPASTGYSATTAVTIHEGSPYEVRRKQDPLVVKTREPKKDLLKRLARKLLTECNYFNLLKRTDQMLYDGLKSKLKHFHPAFHSITPEGLNSRLTFLHQCMRPGDTIPTVNKSSDGRTELIYNDVTNSVFGAPPVCILRIGDFFHTKIVIDSINFKYEDGRFDLNPEGIGVQPMICDVSLNFNFIGGQGIKEPVSKLQNALSFNYYANTEMYDERAEVTEELQQQELTDELIKRIKDELGILDDVNKPRTDDKGDTIGVIVKGDYDIDTEKPFGTLSYEKIMQKIADENKLYVNATFNNLKKVNEETLLGGVLLLTKDRDYTTGNFDYLNGNLTYNANIFGKGQKIQNKIESLVSETINDVDVDFCPLLSNLQENDFTKQQIRKVKSKIKEMIETRGTEVLSSLETANSSIVNEELNLVFSIDKLNYVSSGFDGYISKKGTPIVFGVSGTSEVDPTSGVANTFDELKKDFLVIRTDMNDFYSRMYEKEIIPSGTTYEFNDTYEFKIFIEGTNTGFTEAADIRFFMLFGKPILDNPEKFINEVVSSLNGEPSDVINSWSYYLQENVGYFYAPGTGPASSGLYPRYKESKDVVDKRFKDFEDNYLKNKFNTYNPYNRTKKRIMNYLGQVPPVPPNDQNLKDVWERSGNSNAFNLRKTFV